MAKVKVRLVQGSNSSDSHFSCNIPRPLDFLKHSPPWPRLVGFGCMMILKGPFGPSLMGRSKDGDTACLSLLRSLRASRLQCACKYPGRWLSVNAFDCCVGSGTGVSSAAGSCGCPGPAQVSEFSCCPWAAHVHPTGSATGTKKATGWQAPGFGPRRPAESRVL